MSSQYTNSLEKLQSYSFYKSPRKIFKVSRSLNPEFSQKSKQDDVTRYNSANYNVYFYKDYPNRGGTPIKTNSKMKSLKYQRNVSPKVTFINRLMKENNAINPEAQKKILSSALSAQIRVDYSPPRINIVDPGPKGFVMNDFHKRETNPGYARNGSGGIYTK